MRKFILTHPDNLAEIKRVTGPLNLAEPGTFYGMPIRTSAHMARYRSEWRAPSTRLIEYEKSDEVWLKYFGFGSMVETREPLMLEVEDSRPTLGFMPLASLVCSS